MITPDKLDKNLVYIADISNSVEKIRDAVFFARSYYLIKKKMPIYLRAYLWFTEKLIKMAHRLCQIQLQASPFLGKIK